MNKKYTYVLATCAFLSVSWVINTMEIGSASTADKEMAVKVMTFNICHPAEVQRNPELAKRFSWSERKKGIFSQILHENPDILGLQEVRNEEGGSSVADIWDGLGRHGYNIVSFPNNASPLSFINTIAYKGDKLVLDSTNRWWTSETPDCFSDTWGNGWGRLSLMITLFPIIKKQVGKQVIPYPNYAQGGIRVVNIHNGLKHDERMHANEILVEQIKKLATSGVVIVTGDFNCFPDDGGAEELEILKKAGYQEALTDLKTTTGVPVSGTYLGYSYDKFRSPTGKLGTQLDHIFFRAIDPRKKISITRSHVSLAKRDGTAALGTTEAELLADPDGKECRDEFSSDHAAGIAELVISNAETTSKPIDS